MRDVNAPPGTFPDFQKALGALALIMPKYVRINILMRAIRASEIGSYLYCRRAWWYRHTGEESINQVELVAGTELHRQHGRKVLAAGLQRGLAFLSLLVACVMLVAFGLFYFLGG